MVTYTAALLQMHAVAYLQLLLNVAKHSSILLASWTQTRPSL